MQKWEIAQETIHGVNKELAMRDVLFIYFCRKSWDGLWVLDGFSFTYVQSKCVCVCVLIIINKQPQHAGETTGMLTEQIWTNRTHRIYVWYIYDHLCIFTIIYLHLVDICCI